MTWGSMSGGILFIIDPSGGISEHIYFRGVTDNHEICRVRMSSSLLRIGLWIFHPPKTSQQIEEQAETIVFLCMEVMLYSDNARYSRTVKERVAEMIHR